MESHEVSVRTFTFGAGESLQVLCRRGPEEASRVTITCQMSVQEIWDSFWNFSASAEEDAEPSSPEPEREAEPTELLGLDVWPAAVRLCEYLAAHPALVAGLDVAELGAGTSEGMGLPGLLSAKLGARVLSSDYVQEVVAHLQRNGELNGLTAPAFTALRLDWTDLVALQPTTLHSCRVVLLADVLYQSQLVQPLLGAVLSLLHPQGVVLLGHLPRRAIVPEKGTRIPTLVDDDKPYHKFMAAVAAAGLHVRLLSDGKEPGAGGAAQQRPLLLALALDPAQLERLPAAPS